MKTRSRQFWLGIVALALLTTTTVLVIQTREEATVKPPPSPPKTRNIDSNLSSEIFRLVSLPPSEQTPKLPKIADQGHQLDQNRARYLLATAALDQNEPETALQRLQGLEKQYPLLSGPIWLKRAQAYELKGDTAQAQQIWRQLTQKHLNPAIAAEATYQLGRYNPQQWDKLLNQFPEHPRAHEISRQRIEQNSNPLQPLKILAHYTPEAENMDGVRDRLMNEHSNKLDAKDWEAIAAGYWENWEYEKAAKAYANISKTPKNIYRYARGLELSNSRDTAKTIYVELLNTFPDAEETGLALRRLAEMVSPEDAIFFLDQAINQFPAQAPAALLQKAELFENQGKSQLAKQARNTLLENYSQSEQAIKYRWQMAEQEAQKGKLTEAIDWAQAITTKNQNHSIAAKAGFWAGKWLQQLGETEAAKSSFEKTLSNHPESYYAWRSAVYLGLPVGDFSTVRKRQPEVVKPGLRPRLPAGSDLLQELYRLQQDEIAWELWNLEIAHHSSLSVEEQFTDGVLHLTQGHYLEGINQISSLQYREKPEEISRWQSLRQKPMYWHHLFPFPYNNTILSYSQKRELNPLLTISLIRQESRFEKDIGSVAGAQGLMQIMPSTAEWIANQIDLQDYSLSNPEDNIDLGTWYLDYTHQRYNNNSMLAIASYNAGPGNVSKWIDRYGIEDPDEFVAKIPFPETKGYVESVFGNYWNYLRLYNPEIQALMEK
ncbi:MAG: tail length tape measure protein [Cyanobacteria bacterium SW_9_44_58]|nr:MAG: tail length tape measure protein [Cyanobacteria bacterium SW_9_44_58]